MRNFRPFRKFATLNVKMVTDGLKEKGGISNYLKIAGGLAFVNGLYQWKKIGDAQSEINKRKEGLNKDAIELTGEDAHNFPWAKEGLDNWYYRPVTLTGRFLHNKSIPLYAVVDGKFGAWTLVPFVTKENEDSSEQEGIYVNTGFYPDPYYSLQ